MAAKKASSTAARTTSTSPKRTSTRATSSTKPASGRRTSAPSAEASSTGRASSPSLVKKSSTAKAAKASTKKVTKAAPTPAKGSVNAVGQKGTKPKAMSAKATSVKTSNAKIATAESAESVQEGQRAPSFELIDQSGRTVRSQDLAGAPYVLYFYPKDNTPGCTQEACDFRDTFPTFKRGKIRVFGVSPDSAKSHAGFATKFGLPFPLLVDADKELAVAYGVWAKKKNYGREYFGIVRSTFVVDAKGILRKAWRGVRVAGHAEEVSRVARELR